jgi:spore coat protein U-like protein
MMTRMSPRTAVHDAAATGASSIDRPPLAARGCASLTKGPGAPSQLAYNLYKDASRLLVWGDGGGGVSSNGTNVDLTVYGRIPGAQNVQANVYVDSVTVTVAF